MKAPRLLVDRKNIDSNDCGFLPCHITMIIKIGMGMTVARARSRDGYRVCLTLLIVQEDANAAA